VAVKTVDQQVLQQLHRLRTQWQRAYKARINSLRGMLREFGIDIPVGLARGLAAIREALELADNGLPDALRPFIASVLAEIDGSMQPFRNKGTGPVIKEPDRCRFSRFRGLTIDVRGFMD
jgi:transposase